MSQPTIEKDENILEEFENCGYSYMQRLFDRWKHRVYFHEMAKARLGCILGYILGLKHAGQEEMANNMAKDIQNRLDQLSLRYNEFEVVTETKDEDGNDKRKVTKVPMQKCVVGDDGTWHGFTLMWYRLLNPAAYQEHYNKARKEIDQANKKAAELREKINNTETYDGRKALLEETHATEIYETPHQLVVKRLGIVEHINPHDRYSEELNEYRYIDGRHEKFYYVPSHNGGLIYHGPGAGETFTVNLGTETLWGIHT